MDFKGESAVGMLWPHFLIETDEVKIRWNLLCFNEKLNAK